MASTIVFSKSVLDRLRRCLLLLLAFLPALAWTAEIEISRSGNFEID
jgi:hypothetical protein